MKKRKFIFSQKIPARFRFVRFVLWIVILSFCVNTYFSIDLIKRGFVTLDFNYFILQINFTGLVLILAITLVSIIHRGFGGLFRLEETLDKIIKGDYSQRLTLRKNDILFPFIEKFNQVLELLEKNAKKM